MRDYRGLEEITDAISRGVLVDDVIIAVDQALGEADLGEDERASVLAGESLLRDLAHPDRAASSANAASGLVAMGAVVGAASRSVGREPPADIQTYLDNLAEKLNALATRNERHEDDLMQVVALFSFLGDAQLARASSVSRERQDPARWLLTPTRSSLS